MSNAEHEYVNTCLIIDLPPPLSVAALLYIGI